MERKKYLEDIQEPCYFDFLYEEISQQTEAEILNTILFEAILRTKDIKPIIDEFPNPTDNLNKSLESNTSDNMSNPLYETINSFEASISKLENILKILKIENDNTISKEEIIQLFFDGDVYKYQSSLNSLTQIQNIIKDELLPNINLDINFEQKYNTKSTISLLDSFNKYGLDFYNTIDYLKQLENFINKQISNKQILYKELLNTNYAPNKSFTKYSNYIKSLVKQYKTYSHMIINSQNKTTILFGKRPISNLITSLEIKLYYLPNDNNYRRLKKALQELINDIDESSIKNKTQNYYSFINKEKLEIFAMKSKTFSQTLFVYDYLDYKTNKGMLNSQKEAIEHLIYMYPALKTNWKTLENNVNKFRNLIKYLEEI